MLRMLCSSPLGVGACSKDAVGKGRIGGIEIAHEVCAATGALSGQATGAVLVGTLFNGLQGGQSTHTCRVPLHALHTERNLSAYFLLMRLSLSALLVGSSSSGLVP